MSVRFVIEVENLDTFDMVKKRLNRYVFPPEMADEDKDMMCSMSKILDSAVRVKEKKGKVSYREV